MFFTNPFKRMNRANPYVSYHGIPAYAIFYRPPGHEMVEYHALSDMTLLDIPYPTKYVPHNWYDVTAPVGELDLSTVQEIEFVWSKTKKLNAYLYNAHHESVTNIFQLADGTFWKFNPRGGTYCLDSGTSISLDGLFKVDPPSEYILEAVLTSVGYNVNAANQYSQHLWEGRHE